jgi:hypothetical protein
MYRDPQKLFDTHSESVQRLISERSWNKLVERNKLMCILDYVKNEIPFGFTPKICLPASLVISTGRGQTFSKSILLKTLLEACGVLCRWHAFMVKKELYEGLLRGPFFRMLPETLISVWVEVFYDNHWLVADGVLLDAAYLHGLQRYIPFKAEEFVGYGAGIFLTGTQMNSDWNGKQHNYCQRAAIVRDLGLVEDYEWFFEEYKHDLKILRRIFPAYANKVIDRIRKHPGA